jgi:uncharacterized protein YlxW (UPF0749 family)
MKTIGIMKAKFLKFRRKLSYRIGEGLLGEDRPLPEETSVLPSKDKWSLALTGLILVLILGLTVFTAQQRLSARHRLTQIPQEEINRLTEEKDKLRDENARLRDDNLRLASAINEAREANLSLLDLSTEENQALLQAYRDASYQAGFWTYEGPGIRVSLQDKEGIRYDKNTLVTEIVHDADVHYYVDFLKAHEALAIQVNGERLAPTSPLLCVGSSILVNRVYHATPFVIEAGLDDAEALAQNLLNSRTYQAMVSRGLRVTIEYVENIKIEPQDDLIYVEEQVKRLGG